MLDGTIGNRLVIMKQHLLSPWRPAPDAFTSFGFAAMVLFIALAGSARVLGQSHPWMRNYEGSQSCTGCHRTAATDVMATTHWTWEHVDSETGQKLGKKNMINNFCISLPSNEPRCTSCHIGWGYSDKNFDFNDATKVDCLVCHDTTGLYRKFPAGSGLPVTGAAREFPAGSGIMWPPVDLVNVAQNVGLPTRANCGTCHFFGGGGDAVKHGDIDSTLYNPTREVDVHMAADGANFQCTDCHETTAHKISGTRFSKTYTDNQMCERCHTSAPHAGTGAELNQHTDRIACQTCHIPAFARGDHGTKMAWDWSTAGMKDQNGKNFVIKNADGEPVYDTQKGNFIWERDVIPQYEWYNGGLSFITLDDVVDPAQVVKMNRLHGSVGDAKARIVPVKRFTGQQPYDAAVSKLAMPHLFPTGAADTNAYWKVFDWKKALTAGMEYAGRSFSGNVGWVRTEMTWIQNHMVAPKEQALSCTSCHVPQGRLNFAALGYAPERAAALQTMFGFEIALTEVSAGSGGLKIKCQPSVGHRYRLQFSKDLRGWTEMPASEQAANETGGELSWSESMEGDAVRYYRIVRFSN